LVGKINTNRYEN